MGIVLSLLLLTGLLSSCESVFFTPSDFVYYQPSEMGYTPEELIFSSPDGTRLTGWYFPSKIPEKKKLIILQFHGNGENMTSHFTSLVWATKLGFELITFDYREYGQSDGVATQQGVIDDSVAAYDLAIRIAEDTDQQVILYGQSIGGAILLKALEKFKNPDRIHSVFIDSGFLDYQDIASDFLTRTWVSWPFQWLPYIVVSNAHSPTHFPDYFPPGVLLTVIHGDNDTVIPLGYGREIFDLANEPKLWIQAKNARHIQPLYMEEYRQRFLEIVDSVD